jgi:hypothetical protein
VSVRFTEALETLALGQALMVAPALGDSFEGKTLQTAAALLVMLASDARTLADRRAQACAGLAVLFAGARVDDPSLARDLRELATAPDLLLADRHERMLAAFALLHAWADGHDPALAADCRAWLVEWTRGEVLDPPAHPGG